MLVDLYSACIFGYEDKNMLNCLLCVVRLSV